MAQLIQGIATGVGAIAVAIVTYKKPKHAAKINTAITIAVGAVGEIAMLWG